MAERRSLWQSWFGGREKPPETTRYELVNSYGATYVPWGGRLYENDIARTAIWTIAEAASKAAFVHVRGDGPDMRVHPDPMMRLLLEQPNEIMTMQDFIAKMVIHLELYSNAFALVGRGPGGKPVALYPLDFSTVELEEDRAGTVYCKFRFRGGAKVLKAPYSDVIHLRKHFNSDDFFGESNRNAMQNLMEIINTTDQGIVNAVKNSAVISWLLKFKQTLKPEDIKKQVQEFSESYLRTTSEGLGAAPTDPRYDAEQVKQDNYVPNAPQMDKAKQRVYAYYGVNEAIVQKTYNEDQWNAWFEGKIEPILMQIAKQLTMKFFSAKERAFRNRIMPESTAMAFASMTSKLALVAMVDRGAMLPNEWREAMNLPPIEGGDKPLRRLDTQTVEQAEGDAPAQAGAKAKPTGGLPVGEPLADGTDADGSAGKGGANAGAAKAKKTVQTKEGQAMDEQEQGQAQRARQQQEPRHDWAFEVRAAAAAQQAEAEQASRYMVEGRAITFDAPTLMYERDGIKYYEVIERGALDGADMADVPMRYNHSQSYMIVARHNAARPNRSNMDFVLDQAGLLIRADLGKTESGRQLHEAIAAGLVDGMSFAFTVLEERYDQTSHTRYITKIKKLWDVSAVDTPAYDTTSIYARDRFQAEAESEKKAAEAAERRRRQLALDIDTTLAIYCRA